MLYQLSAPAKLNYFLHLTGRRQDGMHLLQSAFVLIDLMDTISLMPTSGDICRDGDIIGRVEDDLCVRAAQLLKAATGVKAGCAIHVKKRIPAGAGMGGGSSDAATTLIGLNQLWGCGLRQRELMELGLQLGADVPFFLLGEHAWVEGIGEKLTPLTLDPMRFAVIWPGLALSTATIFRHPHLTISKEPITIQDFTQALKAEEKSDEKSLRNDLQSVAMALVPEVQRAYTWLKPHGPTRMTGSGSAVFAKIAQATIMCFDSLPSHWHGYTVNTLPAHPLQGWCDA